MSKMLRIFDILQSRLKKIAAIILAKLFSVLSRVKNVNYNRATALSGGTDFIKN
jgi:hypothetical protein